MKAKNVCGYDVYHIEIPLQHSEKEKYEELTERMWLLYRKLLKLKPELKEKIQKELYETLRRIAGDKKTATAKDAALYLNLSFQRKETVCLASARVQCAECLIELIGTGQKVIVFGERISQAEELYRILQKQFPGKTGRCHSKMGVQANKNSLERFQNGETRILITCKSLDEGINIPDASIGIILSGTSMQRQRTQRLGRIIRKAEGKEKASLYYLHAAETSEEQCFLPEADTSKIYELKYCPDTQKFTHEAYDRLAEAVFEQMCRKNISPEVKQEIVNCLYRESIRSDWQKDDREIRRNIEKSGCMRDRNYRICMRKMKEGTAQTIETNSE